MFETSLFVQSLTLSPFSSIRCSRINVVLKTVEEGPYLLIPFLMPKQGAWGVVAKTYCRIDHPALRQFYFSEHFDSFSKNFSVPC